MADEWDRMHTHTSVSRPSSQMLAINFVFPKHPSGKAGRMRVSVLAYSQEQAWELAAKQLDSQVDELMAAGPKIEVKEIRHGEVIISGPEHGNTEDPWPQIVSEGIRDITTAITDTVGSANIERTKVELEGLKIDRLVLTVLSVGFLIALISGVILLAFDKSQAVFNFLFPIITGLIGLVGGYIGGRKAGGTSSER
jgi:hypothetical protein